MTRGLSAKRTSRRASEISNRPSCKMVWAQKAISRGVSFTSIPWAALNHCLPESTRVNSAIGQPVMLAKLRTKALKFSSGAESSRPDSSSTCRRCISSAGVGAVRIAPLCDKAFRVEHGGEHRRGHRCRRTTLPRQQRLQISASEAGLILRDIFRRAHRHLGAAACRCAHVE